MAWRDSRSSRWRLLLFSISISLGVAALIAIGLFRASLARAIDDQARSLLGADLVVVSSRPFTAEQEQILRSLGETQAREVRFRTMALFEKWRHRLVHVRALGGLSLWQDGNCAASCATFAMAEKRFRKKVFFNSEAKLGDPIKIGGPLSPSPRSDQNAGEASPAASFAPRVYPPAKSPPRTCSSQAASPAT